MRCAFWIPSERVLVDTPFQVVFERVCRSLSRFGTILLNLHLTKYYVYFTSLLCLLQFVSLSLDTRISIHAFAIVNTIYTIHGHYCILHSNDYYLCNLWVYVILFHLTVLYILYITIVSSEFFATVSLSFSPQYTDLPLSTLQYTWILLYFAFTNDYYLCNLPVLPLSYV